MQNDFSKDLLPERDEPAQSSGQPGDATLSARLAMKTQLPKRFYAEATVEERDGGYHLLLDGRPARTPGRNPLALPTRAAGEALAEEWRAQVGTIDPGRMPLTRITNSAIDGVAGQMEAVIEEIVKYAASDLVCYRAGDPERLVAAQDAAWAPVLAFARENWGARFLLSEGIVFVEQPPEAIEAIRNRVARETSPFRVAALHVMTTLTGSALIALAAADGGLGGAESWAAAHVDEIVQESIWGEDAEATRRRALREADYQAALRLFALTPQH